MCVGQGSLRGTPETPLPFWVFLVPFIVFICVLPGERYDPEPKSKWDEEWDKKSAFPFSDKLGELSDKIGSTIDDTISKFRRKDREDSPERCRYWSCFHLNLSVRLLLRSSLALLDMSYNLLPFFLSEGGSIFGFSTCFLGFCRSPWPWGTVWLWQ